MSSTRTLRNSSTSARTTDGKFVVQYWQDVMAPTELINTDCFLLAADRALKTIDSSAGIYTLHCRDPLFESGCQSLGLPYAIRGVTAAEVRAAIERLPRYSAVIHHKDSIDICRRAMRANPSGAYWASSSATSRSQLTGAITALVHDRYAKAEADAARCRNAKSQMQQAYELSLQERQINWTPSLRASLEDMIERGDTRGFWNRLQTLRQLADKRRQEGQYGRR
ncbi:Conserved oligomeric Golgi complex subunit 5 [Sphaceloma murrayae]|uniref:Conserved oligomeric Golgi complex subunit 5 n=1 Tax=Sphaceloma murrayae TaxID=2082308 RepID=A0A2K1QG49_9PEZI|nr:Conserved oligomeric Golgi complex subunit 5 [Sphaceloma murrayae]